MNEDRTGFILLEKRDPSIMKQLDPVWIDLHMVGKFSVPRDNDDRRTNSIHESRIRQDARMMMPQYKDIRS